MSPVIIYTQPFREHMQFQYLLTRLKAIVISEFSVMTCLMTNVSWFAATAIVARVEFKIAMKKNLIFMDNF